MAIGEQDFLAVDHLLSNPEIDGEALSLLRQKLPHLRFARCDASDVEEQPQRSYPRFDLHFLDNRDFCMKIVASADEANGFVLARRKI